MSSGVVLTVAKSTNITVMLCSARLGCTGGKFRALILAQLLDDWVSRTICPTWHMPLGETTDVDTAVNWLQTGTAWIADASKTPRLAFGLLLPSHATGASFADCR
jgi:hypothetical protein